MNPDEKRDWFFTFGCGQEHSGKYVKFHGTWLGARNMMIERYGTKWCGQYESAEQAGVGRWGYVELEVKP